MNAEALARVLCAADGHQPDDRDIMMLALRPYAMWERYVTQAELIVADPAPLLAALPDSAIEAEALRRFYPARHMTGLSDQ